MGHTTRCIPLIEYFIEKNYEVYVAANDVSISMLKSIFPDMNFLYIKGYNVKYSKTKWALPFVIFFQIPKIIAAILYEHNWLKKTLNTQKIDIVISDNRYGFYSNKIKSIFITHQLNILVPQSPFLEKILKKLNRFFLKKFDEIWVPDYASNIQAGKLSKNDMSLNNLKYIGNLSRFSNSSNESAVKYEILIILSGPEPQRSILEKIILQQVQKLSFKMVMVRGTKNNNDIALSVNENIEYIDFATKNELEHLIRSSEILVSRSGYSTIMDFVKLKRHAILIPTPGQTEQEFLADYLSEKNWYIACQQNKFNLKDEVEKYRNTTFNPFPLLNFQLFKKYIDEL